MSPWRIGAAALLGMLGVAACKKTPPPAAGDAASTTGAAATSAPPQVVGMEDPFARPNAEAARALNAGYRALRARKYDEARAAFASVVRAAPDHTAARFQEVRAAILGNHFGDVPDLWKELLARDFVAYAGRLARPKEFVALRAAPEWARVQALEGGVRPAYAADLGRGLFFVARTRDPGPPHFGADGEAKLELSQEVYHYDPTSGRYRRLTETGGHVWAIGLSPDRKLLTFLVTPRLTQEAATGKTDFTEPQGGMVDLATLETVGPFKLPGPAHAVTLGFSANGEPLWRTDSGAYTFDATRTALVPIAQADSPAQAAADPAGGAPHTTRATPESVSHLGAPLAGAQRSDDGRAVILDGGDKPLRAAREIAPESLAWSPGKKRLVYAGVLDACKVLAAGGKGDKNELFLWDTDKKLAVRVASAISAFATHWLDEDHLVYEGGVGKDGKLHVYEVPTRKDTVLKPRYGAGLYGYPSLACAPAPSEPAEPADIDVAGEEPADAPAGPADPAGPPAGGTPGH
jgi:hypothetical protein